MALIHKLPVNLIIRTVLRPFRKLVPSKYHFAIDGTLKIDLTEGKQLIFHANPTSNLLRVLYWYGIEGFEYKEYKVFVELAKKSKVFFDIGANIGYYSIVAKIFNPKIEVHGFEPMPSAFKYFNINKALNNCKDISTHCLALTDHKGEEHFYSNLNPRFPHIKDHLFGDNSLNEAATGNISKIRIDVKTDTLDNFVADNLKQGQKIDLIKLDTESTEHLVMKGSHKVLFEHRPIIMCEVIKGFTEKEIASILSNYNYAFFEVMPNGLKKVEKLIVKRGKNDYFFVPEEKTNLVEGLIIK
jgi:FkbM family methyltransferase